MTDGAGPDADASPSDLPDSEPIAFIGDHPDLPVDLAMDLLAFDTKNPPGATADLADWVAEEFHELGLATERVTVDPAKPNLLATLPGETDRVLCFNGHLDTVPYDADEWSADPLGDRDGNRIYGRGATDMKGAIAAMLATARAFVATDTTPPVTLLFALVSDEETGGDAGLPALLERDHLAAQAEGDHLAAQAEEDHLAAQAEEDHLAAQAEEDHLAAQAEEDHLQADACVIGEPTCEQGRHSVTVADRGSIWLTLSAEGEAAHGSRPMLGANAIDRLYEAIETLRERFGDRRLEVDADVAAIVDESVAYYEPIMGADVARRLFEYPTINLGTFEGGDAINSVPQSATAEIDIRLTASVQTPELLADVRACADDCDGVTVANVSWSIGSAVPVDAPVVDATAAVAEAATGERIYRRSATGGGDAKDLRHAGISTVEFALATDTAHAVDEYTTTDILRANARIYTALPDAFAERL